MPAATLKELAKTRLIQNIHLLTDIGDIPYDLMAPIIRHIQNPAQLLELEANCPQIVGETGEIWLRFIKRDIPNWDSKVYRPKDPRNWSKAYKKLKKDAEKERLDDEQRLKDQINKLQQSRQGNQTKIIESKVPIDPSARSRGFGFSRGSGGSGNWGSGSWGIGAPAKTGKVAFDKLRRGVFDQKRAAPKAARMPAHLLAERKGTVLQAPARMVRIADREAAAAAARPRPQQSAQQQAQQTQNSATGERSRLPPGKFNIPKPPSQQTSGAQPVKRKREEPNMFMQRKRKP